MSNLPQIYAIGQLTPAGYDLAFRLTDCPFLPLAVGQLMLVNEIACIDFGTTPPTVKTAASGNANLVPIGLFEQDLDNTQGATTVDVPVRLPEEIRINYFLNDTVNPITSRLQAAYLLNGRTVTASSASGANAKLGMVWDIDDSGRIGVGPSRVTVTT